MKSATIFLLLLAIFTIIPFKKVELEPLLEEEINLVVFVEELEVQTINVHYQAQIKDILPLVKLHPDSDTSTLDVNEPVYNDMVITIPLKQKKSCVSINSADLESLMTLNGVGEATALKIIEYRQTNPFLLIEDLMNVKGIGIKKFEKIKESICL